MATTKRPAAHDVPAPIYLRTYRSVDYRIQAQGDTWTWTGGAWTDDTVPSTDTYASREEAEHAAEAAIDAARAPITEGEAHGQPAE